MIYYLGIYIFNDIRHSNVDGIIWAAQIFVLPVMVTCHFVRICCVLIQNTYSNDAISLKVYIIIY